jgi:hypothetical protein
LIDAKPLLNDLKHLLRRLESDLRERAAVVPDMRVSLEREYQAARGAERTGEAFKVWREGLVTQPAATWYIERVEHEGWPPERLQLLLAGLAELIPWCKQWHNDIDAEFNQRLGDFFESFLQGQLQRHGLPREGLNAWTPPQTNRVRRRGP